jgi:hypothetical protein
LPIYRERSVGTYIFPIHIEKEVGVGPGGKLWGGLPATHRTAVTPAISKNCDIKAAACNTGQDDQDAQIEKQFLHDVSKFKN